MTTFAEARAFLLKHRTDYDAAVAAAQGAYSDAGKLATTGVQNVSYFMSDGVPNESNGTGSNGIVGSEVTASRNLCFLILFALRLRGHAHIAA